MNRFKRLFLLVLPAAAILWIGGGDARAALPPTEVAYAEINLSDPEASTPLEIVITPNQAAIHGWKPRQVVQVKAHVERAGGRKEPLRDRDGRKAWRVRLGESGEGRIRIWPADDCFSGRLTVLGNGKKLYTTSPDLMEILGRTVEKVYQYRFEDGASVRVYFTDQVLEECGETAFFAKDVLDAAVSAYQTITQMEGFRTSGFSFANPDTGYAADPDRTIDIVIGNPGEANAYPMQGFNVQSFRDAPCFDTVKVAEHQYNAVILLPADYKGFIRNWEKINPSSLGERRVEVDLRGTLIHEMLHVIVFYYNRNLMPQEAPGEAKPSERHPRHMDWYVEGLARYFETFAGAKHDFFSHGFKQTLADRVRFSRGGTNYYMRWPDQPFTNLRYENALFWRYIDYRYGMQAIERLTREFRTDPQMGAVRAVELLSGGRTDEFLERFALAVLEKDFGLKGDSVYLMNIATTRLHYREDGLYLQAGEQRTRLGETCRTDWIGDWQGQTADFKDASLAGDGTRDADIAGWATDFIELSIDEELPALPRLEIRHREGGRPVAVQLVLASRGGSRVTCAAVQIGSGSDRDIDLAQTAAANGLRKEDVEKVYLLLTNTDPRTTARYEISARA